MDKKEVRVSQGKPYTSYVGASKEILRTQDYLELHGLGEASSNVIRAAEMLVSLGYATLEKFETLTISEPSASGLARTRAKVIIKLSKASGFEKAYEDFNTSRSTKK
jgi:Alba